MNKEKNFVSAVVYVHNAEKTIGSFLAMLIRVMESNFEHAEIICVNDGSEDQSAAVIKKVSGQAGMASVSLINMSYFHGMELAMNAGIDLAIGDFVFEFDRPVQDFEESMIMDVYRRCLEGYDIVSASVARREKLSSSLFYKLFYHFGYLHHEMHTESFRVLSRRVINRIDSMNKIIPYRKAVYANSGLKTDEMKYKPVLKAGFSDDRQGRRYRKELAADTLILFTDVGYSFAKTMTLLMMVFSIFMILYSLITYFLYHPVEGWTTTILFLSVGFFGLFGILTVIIKYLQIIVNLVFKRKHYSYESIEKLTK